MGRKEDVCKAHLQIVNVQLHISYLAGRDSKESRLHLSLDDANVSPVTMNIFLTGATGFVGGTILASLQKTHPEIRIKALIRREEDAKELQSIYSNLEPIVGEISSLSLLTSTAATADFVIHATREDIPAAHALIDGLASSSPGEPPLPRLISVTGPRSLVDQSHPATGAAETNSSPWSDITDVQTILSLPKERPHAEADRSIVAHSIANGVGTMLVSPGQLWGRGKGHSKKESAAAAYYAAVKSRGRAFVIGDGSVAWSWVSIGDLGEAVVFLMEQALLTGDETRRKVSVNEAGYYFVQTGDVSMVERAEAVSKRLGFGDVESVPPEVTGGYHLFGPLMWGRGERFRSDRLEGMGWTPKEVDWRPLMEEEGGERA